MVTIGLDSEMIYRADIKILIMIVTALLFIFPLSLLKNLSGFRYISLFILFVMYYVCLALLFELPAYFSANYSPEAITYFAFDWNFFPALATTMFAYSCHVSLINIYDEMSEPSKTGGYTIVDSVMFMNFIMFIIISVSGYLSTFNNTPGLILERVNVFTGSG